jgi:hypothetical protein
MLLSALSALFCRDRRRAARAGPPRRRPFRPRLEALEDRCVPAMLWFVTSPADNPLQAGTLRYAVDFAQNGDTIWITQSATAQPIWLTHGELYLAHDVTIETAPVVVGSPYAPATITGNNQSRVFEVAPTAHVTLENLVISDGNAVAHNAQGYFPADGRGGGIFNEGTLSLAYCTVSCNSAYAGGGGILTASSAVSGFQAGAVGTLTVSHCILSGNTTYGEGGGIANFGGNVTVDACHLTGNFAYSDSSGEQIGVGGGLANEGLMVVSNSNLDHNHADDDGGAIWNHHTLQVLGCTFVQNQAVYNGGGIGNGGSALVLSCTFRDNVSAAGGGIYNRADDELILGFSNFQNNPPGDLNNQGTYYDLGGNTFG